MMSFPAATPQASDERGFVSALVGDGTPLLSLTGVCLLLSGVFASFLGMTGHFLPHDVAFLGMMPEELCAVNECRIVHFMIHDRISFGGALIAIGLMYLWLATFPLRAGEAWAWWLFAVSGVLGFAFFLAYLGYGYLDTWHGVATLALLPIFLLGLTRSYAMLRHGDMDVRPADHGAWLTRRGVGRALLLGATAGMVGAGAVIMLVGMTTVFVPQDLAYMGVTVEELHAVNPRLVPLIAHDRAGFGGAVCCCGIIMAGCVWCARLSRSLWQALALAGAAGFSTAIGVHPAIGYTDWFHLAPAVVGGVVFFVGMLLTSSWLDGRRPQVA
jgi:hypothetical protein